MQAKGAASLGGCDSLASPHAARFPATPRFISHRDTPRASSRVLTRVSTLESADRRRGRSAVSDSALSCLGPPEHRVCRCLNGTSSVASLLWRLLVCLCRTHVRLIATDLKCSLCRGRGNYRFEVLDPLQCGGNVLYARHLPGVFPRPDWASASGSATNHLYRHALTIKPRMPQTERHQARDNHAALAT